LGTAVDGVLAEHLSLSATTEFTLMAITLVLVLLGAWYAWKLYGEKTTLDSEPEDMPVLKRLIARKWMLDELYAYLFEKPFGWLSRTFFSVGEAKVAVPLTAGMGEATHRFADWLRKVHTGNTSLYIFAMMLGVVVLLLITWMSA
jgi:NADH-quinone oxidoreductase subunit L